MDAILLLTSGLPQSGRDAIAPVREAKTGNGGNAGGFAAMLTRAVGDAPDGGRMMALDTDTGMAGEDAATGASRLALTVAAGGDAPTFSLDDAAEAAEAAKAAAEDTAEAAPEALAAAAAAGEALLRHAHGQAAQAAQASAARTAAQADAAKTAARDGAAEEPGLLEAAAEDAEADADAALERARKTAFEDFEIAWRRLASGRRLDVDAATLKLKPAGADEAMVQRGQPVAAQIDGGASLLQAKADGAEASNPQAQFGLDGAKAAERAGSPDAAAKTPAAANSAASPGEQVAMQIRRAAAGGADRITLQLHPRDLGGVEVRLEFGDNHTVRAAVLVERPETLELLQRDARQLQRALEEAGLTADGGSLSFDLRGEGNQGGFADGNGGADGEAGGFPGPDGEEADDAADRPVEISTYAMAIADGRLDIRI